MIMQKNTPNTMRYASLATQWMAMLLIAVVAGHKLDAMIKWKVPVLLILFPLVALGVSLWQLIKELNKPGK